VSRVDTLVDRLLEQALKDSKNDAQRNEIQSLFGRAAIANSRLVYQKFKEIFPHPVFRALPENGARVQRPRWASTSTKNPNYRDVIYVEELSGPYTVNTPPLATLEAFRDHGLVCPALESDFNQVKELLACLEALGIQIERVVVTLQTEGVRLFADSFETLMRSLAAKKEGLTLIA